MEKLRVIPKKNYIILGIIFIVTFLILYYFYMWVEAYKDTKLNMPILDKYMEKINYNELDNFLVENPDSIIYISVLENEEIRTFEKKFRTLFKNKLLKYDVLYMDITLEKDDKNIREGMKEKYSMNSINIYDVPSIMVIDNGKIKYIYNIHDNGYDIGGIENFINSINFTSEEMNND